MPTNDKFYSPDWTKLSEYYEKYASTTGIGRTEANRHLKALKQTIEKTKGDLDQRRQQLAMINPKTAAKLFYMNPASRLSWLKGAVTGFETLKPDAPFFAITVVKKAWDRTTRDDGNGVAEVKEKIKGILSDLKASSFGHVETAVFPKKVTAGAYHSAPHGQIIVWGVELLDLRAALKPSFPPLEDGTLGYMVKPITTKFFTTLSYATKAPAYGYSAWPMEGGDKRHEPMAITQRGHHQLLKQFADTTWLDVNIATGEGIKVRKTAIQETGYQTSASKSPLTDKLKAKNEVSADSPLKILTLENGVDPALKFSPKGQLKEEAKKATEAYEGYLGTEKQSRDVLYEFLGRVYRLACASADREPQLKKLVTDRGIPLNAQSDLISLSLKIALPKDHDKRRASEWGSALRYLYGNGCKPMAVPAALRENGGTRNCANALKGRTAGGETATSKIDEQEAWKLVKEHGNGFEVASNRVDLPVVRAVLIAGRNKDGNRLFVRHFIPADEKLGRDFLQKIANDLTRKSAKAKKAAS